ncbi:MAG: hypothetical protein HYV27_01345 [Candidatus Hydrogenedentes bacterium]|nr:hypothetical protein [Candidatus Hydrogenedentota bacterium]
MVTFFRHPSFDCVLALAVMLVAMAVAVGYLSSSGSSGNFRRDWFAPAAMMAEGYGLVNPDLTKMKALEAFIAGKTPYWNPAEDHGRIAFKELLGFGRDHANLIRAVALCWYVLGCRWDALITYHALIFALTCGLAYGLCRQAMPKSIALIVTLAFMLSPAHLIMIPEIRDYSKAPFIIGTLFACAFLVRLPRSLPTVFGIAAILGVFVGIGLGFRADMTLCILPVLLTCLCFLPYPWKRSLAVGLLASLLFLVALYAGGRESFHTMWRYGSDTPHNVTGGLYSGFDELMGLQPSYRHDLYNFNDHYIAETATSYYRRVVDPAANPQMMKPEYLNAARQYLFAVWRQRPADLLSRAFASTWKMLETAPTETQEEFGVSILLNRIARFFAHPIIFMAHWGRWVAVLALLCLAAIRIRFGLFVALALLYFCGSPSLQYMPRHFFHLSFATWFFPGLLASLLCGALAPLGHRAPRAALQAALPTWAFWRPPMLRMGVALAAAFLFLLMPWWILGWIQSGKLLAHAKAVNTAPRAPLPYTVETADGREGRLLRAAPLPEPDAAKRAGVSDAYLMAEFAGPPGTFAFIVRYESSLKFSSLEQIIPVELSGAGTTRIYFPVYERTEPARLYRRFLGIELAPETIPFLKGIHTVSNARDFALWPTLLLVPGWEEGPHRLTLAPAGNNYTQLLQHALPGWTQ